MIEIKKTLSEHIWGLDWRKYLPLSLGDYELHLSSFEEFIKLKKMPGSFLVTSDISTDSFIKDTNSSKKEAYLSSVVDFFSIRKEGQIVGVFIGELKDWTSFYARYLIVMKEHRANNLNVLTLGAVESILNDYGVEKMCCDVAPSNIKQISRMCQAGYVCTGNVLSERFGATVSMTKFLNQNSLDVFNKCFVQMYYTDKNRESMKPSRNILKEYV